MEKEFNNKAGFWIRFLAVWIDFLLIYTILRLLFYSLLFSSVYIYFNFQFAFFILLIVYSTVSIAFKGQTVGKLDIPSGLTMLFRVLQNIEL